MPLGHRIYMKLVGGAIWGLGCSVISLQIAHNSISQSQLNKEGLCKSWAIVWAHPAHEPLDQQAAGADIYRANSNKKVSYLAFSSQLATLGA